MNRRSSSSSDGRLGIVVPWRGERRSSCSSNRRNLGGRKGRLILLERWVQVMNDISRLGIIGGMGVIGWSWAMRSGTVGVGDGVF